MKHLSILGSTGSIGCNALQIVTKFPDQFNVAALTAKSNVNLLADQVIQFKPQMVAVYDLEAADRLKELLPKTLTAKVVYGQSGYNQAAGFEKADTVINAMVGAAGLIPTLTAIDSGKQRIALANKETLVMAGQLVMTTAREKNVQILPVDSEHSAIFQCIRGNNASEISELILTASGGPFLNRSKTSFDSITLSDALNHPTWTMGQKITIDSATLMNKGLEVIEAHHLFALPHDKIRVVIHPQSIIHSMVAFVDGAVMAQIGVPDMKGAISYALSFPERLPLNMPIPDFAKIKAFTFEDPDFKKFECLALAYEACQKGGTLPAILNAANEAVVYSFLEEKIAFADIPKIIAQIMQTSDYILDPDLDQILAADHWAREKAHEMMTK